MASKILVTGGTGLVGSLLVNELRAKKYEVVLLTTNPKRAKARDAFLWTPGEAFIEEAAFEGVAHVIHLAGAGVADKPWTDARKKVLYESRVDTARLLAKHSKKYQWQSFITASAIGYYGMDTRDAWLNEEAKAGNDFLAGLVTEWEAAADEVQAMRVAKLRIGVVLSKDGGALPKIAAPLKYGVGAPLGNGQQYMSWIAIEDLVQLFIHLVEKSLVGVFNGVAPHPVTNKEFTKTLGRVLNRPVWLPHIPGFLIHLAFGEMAQVVLGGNRVAPKSTMESGFSFKFPNLEGALREAYKK